MTSLKISARSVKRCTEHDHVEGDDCPSAPFFTFGAAVRIAAPPMQLEAPCNPGEGRWVDPASPMARRHHGRIGIVVLAERCERELVPRMLYSVVIWPAIQVRLYACELERYDGAPGPNACAHGFPADVSCPTCDAGSVGGAP